MFPGLVATVLARFSICKARLSEVPKELLPQLRLAMALDVNIASGSINLVHINPHHISM